MKLRIVALYPTRLTELLSQPEVRERRRKSGGWTQVPCDLAADGDRSVAKPIYEVPNDAPRPAFRAVLELSRSDDARRAVAVVMTAETSSTEDPEQRVVAPLYNNGRKVLFEFQRAEILIVTAGGQIELRIVAVHPVTGVVGTRTKYVFHSKLAKLVGRCHAHLAGSIDLFPPQDPVLAKTKDFQVPDGQANLDLNRLGGLKATRPKPALVPSAEHA